MSDPMFNILDQVWLVAEYLLAGQEQFSSCVSECHNTRDEQKHCLLCFDPTMNDPFYNDSHKSRSLSNRKQKIMTFAFCLQSNPKTVPLV